MTQDQPKRVLSASQNIPLNRLVLLDIYAEDGMTLEQLMAFTVTADHARQEQVWDQIAGHYGKQPYLIRNMLTEAAVEDTDKRALFVGVAAYEAAGGAVLRDLFRDDYGGWLQDGALLDRLVAEKLQSEAQAIAAEGWKWVHAAADLPYGHTHGLRRVKGAPVPLTDDEQARYDALAAEQEQLGAHYATAAELPEEAAQRFEAIPAELDSFVDRPKIYPPDEVARAGAFLSIDGEGRVRVERGFLNDTAAARAIDARHEAWVDRLPEFAQDLWDSLTELGFDSRVNLFTHCVSRTVYALCDARDRRPQALNHADDLVLALGLDLRVHWTPTVTNYLGREPKARILEAVREAKGDREAQLIDHLKKPDMAREAERLLAGTGWL